MGTNFEVSNIGIMTLGTQASDPGSPGEADIWYNSTDKKLKYYDGSSVVEAGGGGSDVTLIDTMQSQIEIIEIQADATLTPMTHDSLITDTFSDTTGYLDTINVGNTTAVFNADRYADINEENGPVGIASDLNNTNGSLKISNTGSNNWRLASVQIGFTGSANVTINIRNDSTSALLATTGAVALSFGNQQVSIPGMAFQASSVVFRVEATSSVNNYITIHSTSNPNVTANNINVQRDLTFSTNSLQSSGGGQLYCVAEFEISDAVVVADLPTISGTVTDVEVVLNSDDTTATFDITDGTTTLTDKTINTKIAWTGGGNPDELTLNIVGSNKYIKSYCLKVWK